MKYILPSLMDTRSQHMKPNEHHPLAAYIKQQNTKWLVNLTETSISDKHTYIMQYQNFISKTWYLGEICYLWN